MMQKPESAVWQGTPSQMLNLTSFVLLGAGSLIILVLPFQPKIIAMLVSVPLCLIAWKYLVTQGRKYELTTQRLKSHSGVLSKQIDTEELYRVKDSRFEQPFFLRMLGLGNVILFSTDISSPTVIIEAVPNAQALHDQIRNLVEECRDAKRVRNVEME